MYVVDKKSIEVKHNLYVVTFSLEYVGANQIFIGLPFEMGFI